MIRVVAQLVLIGILTACAISLRKQFDATRSGIRIERTRAAITKRVGPTSIAGVDIDGTIRDVLPDRAKRFVVAGFRSSTIDRDVALWTAVAESLTEEPAVHVIAYCDDAVCADKARKAPRSPRVTVLRYGEPSNVQALLYADDRGDALVLSPQMEVLEKIPWRTPYRRAEDIVQDVRK